MSLAATASGRAAATVKERDLNIIGYGSLGQLLFGFEDSIVSHQIATIFGAIAEPHHDRLAVVKVFEVWTVAWVIVELLHDVGGIFQVFDGFKQRNDADLRFVQ